jgi:hypothetical protein
MARELLVVSWCDAPHEVGEHHATRSVVVEVEGTKPRRIDLCEDDYRLLIEPLVPILAEHGAAPDAAPARANGAKPAKLADHALNSPDPGPCPICGQTYQWVSTHLTSAHHIRAGEATRVDDGHACPVCGEVMASVRPLGAHAMSEHGKRLNVLLAEAQASAELAARRKARVRHPAGKAKP